MNLLQTSEASNGLQLIVDKVVFAKRHNILHLSEDRLSRRRVTTFPFTASYILTAYGFGPVTTWRQESRRIRYLAYELVPFFLLVARTSTMSSPVATASSLNPPRRPSLVQSQSTPGKIMNGHFASVGEEASREQYAQGIQVIDEDKNFKYAPLIALMFPKSPRLTIHTKVTNCRRI